MTLDGFEACWVSMLYLFKQYLDRGAQFSEAGLNGALFNINLLTNNILQNTERINPPNCNFAEFFNIYVSIY